MKNFNYTARDRAGATKRGSLKAIDRAAALHELAAQGMVPLSIMEGAAKEASGLSQKKPFIIAGAIVAVIAAVFLVLNLLPKSSDSAGKKPKKNKVVQTTKKGPVKAPQTASTNSTVAVKTAAEKEPALVPALTNKFVKPKIQVIELYPGCSTNPPLTGYTSITERVINMIVNARPGLPPPPLIDLPPGETNIHKIIETNIILYETDDEDTAEQKANVAYAKQLLKEYLKEGGGTKDFLKYYHEQLNLTFEERSTAQKQFYDLIKAGDETKATEFYEAQNKTLSEKGICPLTLPLRFRLNKKTE
jgi:hypothetical protein